MLQLKGWDVLPLPDLVESRGANENIFARGPQESCFLLGYVVKFAALSVRLSVRPLRLLLCLRPCRRILSICLYTDVSTSRSLVALSLTVLSLSLTASLLPFSVSVSVTAGCLYFSWFPLILSSSLSPSSGLPGR